MNQQLAALGPPFVPDMRPAPVLTLACMPLPSQIVDERMWGDDDRKDKPDKPDDKYDKDAPLQVCLVKP